MNARTVGQYVLLGITLAGLVTAIAAPAEAGLRHHDRVYADSFGNLVIDSAAGYKRIIVGEGKLAKKLSEYTSAGQPDVVYDDADEAGAPGCYSRRCWSRAAPICTGFRRRDAQSQPLPLKSVGVWRRRSAPDTRTQSRPAFLAS